MLNRILEAEVMDTEADAADYDAMDFTAVNQLFATDCLFHFDSSIKKIIDIGTGTARIPIEIAKQSSQVHITAVDLSQSMLKVGQKNVTAAKMDDRIHLQLVDAKGMPFADGSFDAVVSNSIVHHIPNPASFFREAIRLARPAGVIFIRDLFRPANRSKLDELVQTYAGNDTPHQRQLFYDSLHAALTVDEVRDIVKTFGFESNTVQATSDRHWTFAARQLQ